MMQQENEYMYAWNDGSHCFFFIYFFHLFFCTHFVFIFVCCQFISGLSDISINHYLLTYEKYDESRVRYENTDLALTATSECHHLQVQCSFTALNA